ncbi:TatD family hydrolase [Salinigranum halophilum]|uniref:TatD family hydrolase n=1 Tax=Salinigranum halophilum TaxID=2565931 RepID=UPI0010A837D9|nr:TatD family hydrolase [Salinigranum halophilum]
MSSNYPTRRPTDEAYLDDASFDPPTSLLTLPWVDCHNHAHTLSFADRERYAVAGCRSMVMVASGYHWTPYKPVRSEDIRYLWDDVINRKRAIERQHFFETNLALGVHTGVRIEDPDDLLAAMADYCRLDEVVALGETGVTPAQHAEAWALDEQRAVVQAQMELAADHDLPVILHTPNDIDDGPSYRDGVGLPGFESNVSLAREPVLTGENPALEAVKIDVAAAADAGLPEERIVASHADPNNVDYLLGETDCHVSFTVGYPWLTGVDAVDVADAIREYGPDRVMMDTDCANILRTDVFSVKKAIFELYRLGIDVDTIRKVVLENPMQVFGLDD